MKCLPASLVLILAIAVCAEPVEKRPGTGQQAKEPAQTAVADRFPAASQHRLLYEQMPPGQDTDNPDMATEKTVEPNPLIAQSDDGGTEKGSGTADAPSPGVTSETAEKKPLSIMEKYNVHGAVFMGFGTDGLIYGGFGVTADLSDRVSIDVGVSAARWDEDGVWCWPLRDCPY